MKGIDLALYITSRAVKIIITIIIMIDLYYPRGPLRSVRQRPLQRASKYGHKDVGVVLLGYGAEIDARDNFGLHP
jgi:hypothetical protein